MATVVPVTTFPYETSLDVAVTTWYGMGKDDDGEPVQLVVFSDRSVQIAGTFGGASITIGGSNDGVTYHALTDTAGVPLTLIDTALRQIMELPVWIKPRVFGGSPATNLAVIIAGRRSL